MFNYNKKIATVEELNKISSTIAIFHYNRNNTIVVPESFTSDAVDIIAKELQQTSEILKYILSLVSKRIHKFQQGDENMNFFMEKGWKSPILTNTPQMAFILPEQFTQEFIDSKEGKRFKGKQPCAHMFMRALQSQKTIMEQLEVKEV